MRLVGRYLNEKILVSSAMKELQIDIYNHT